MAINRDARANQVPVNALDPYLLAEALIGHRIDRNYSASTIGDLHSEYDDLTEMKHESMLHSGTEIHPDKPPKNVNVGCINPYALVEAIIGRKIDKHSMSSVRILTDILQTDYDELFDMKHNGCLYAGLTLNKGERKAEALTEKDIKILTEKDLETPDLSQVRKLEDLDKLGLKDVLQTSVKMARMQNGKLRVVLNAKDMGKTVSNSEVTMTLNEMALPFRKQKGQWTPPNASWQDMYLSYCDARRVMKKERFRVGEEYNIGEGLRLGHNLREILHLNKFDDPVQGALGNSYLIAALFSVFWADPSVINRRAQPQHQEGQGKDEKQPMFAVKFHDKGGHNNAPTARVEVNYDIPVNSSDDEPMYCRASDGCEIWPMLYEKAFAKWVTGTSSDRPDITKICTGDPIKAMAQINGKQPQYYFTENRAAHELTGLVRSCSVNFKTINPMSAYTYASGNMYRGSNLVANHAYSVLGWSTFGQKQYIIVRNPFGVTEPVSMSSYPGLITQVEPEFWPPASLLDRGGVLAVEAPAFKEYFDCIGMAK